MKETLPLTNDDGYESWFVNAVNMYVINQHSLTQCFENKWEVPLEQTEPVSNPGGM